MSEDWETAEWELFERDAETIMKELNLIAKNKNIEEKELSMINDLFNASDETDTKKKVNSVKSSHGQPIAKKNTHKFVPKKINTLQPNNQVKKNEKIKKYISDDLDDHLSYCCEITDRILHK